MKVKCINIKGAIGLTLNKIYELENHSEKNYCIVYNDYKVKGEYLRYRFDDCRKEKIKKLL